MLGPKFFLSVVTGPNKVEDYRRAFKTGLNMDISATETLPGYLAFQT